MEEVSPEDQLRNVAARLLWLTKPSDQDSGGDQPESYAASKVVIARSGRQLAEMVLSHLDGELKALTWAEDEPPF